MAVVACTSLDMPNAKQGFGGFDLALSHRATSEARLDSFKQDRRYELQCPARRSLPGKSTHKLSVASPNRTIFKQTFSEWL